MAPLATLASVRPFFAPHTPPIARTRIRAASLRLTRGLIATLVALTLAGFSGFAPTHQLAAAAPGDPGATTVPNLAPGNAEIDIDAFWSQLFTAAGFAYSSPVVVPFSAPISSGCGYVTPAELIAFYCAADVAVYWSTPSYDQAALTAGDAAWVNVMAHEWSHHVQVLLGTNTPWRRANDMVSLELEATCMGGVYVADARARALVDDAMISYMVGMFAGSPSHGSTEQVQTAFLTGLDTGPAACGLALPTATTQPESEPSGTAATKTAPATTADTATESTDPANAIAPGTAAHVTAPAVNLRATPSVSAPIRTVLSTTNRLEITGPAQTADGYTWWPVTDQTTGQSGYVAAPFLTT